MEALLKALGVMLKKPIINAEYKTERLHGGTLGDVRLLEGEAVSDDGERLPFKLVSKTQKKWERYGDPESWRREYDLYMSGLGALFTDALRWPECYHAEYGEGEIRLWMEYINGVSGLSLTGEMYERAALELGRFQGRLYAGGAPGEIENLSKADGMKNFYLYYRSWDEVYGYIRSCDCEIPPHLREMLIGADENADETWRRVEELPIVLCHRDFWVTNIFYTDGGIRLIDWDTTGWGHMGEDIVSLLADEADVEHMAEYYPKCVRAYYRGFSEHADVSRIKDLYILERMILHYGYRLVEWYKFAGTPESKKLQLDTLQKIYEIKNNNTEDLCQT
ncbi:MAG: aminoglycoside phosphotransferase family protein [Oscillospiraceae bacterium]|nr:aminoglycoside phosphotransferase family protein [Oscillospiraceae bacterium]